MHGFKYLILLFSLTVFAQQPINSVSISKTKLRVNTLVHIDNFNSQYSIINNALVVKKEDNTINYSNLQLGNITMVNAFNPLKLNIFYKDFNTIVILDNRLAEITKLNFNTLQPLRDISHISTANDNTIWIFNENTRQLELFDFLDKQTKINTLPIDGIVIDLQSNYNYCWLLTDQYLYKYNYFGSLLSKTPNQGFTALKENRESLFLLKENQLFYKAKNNIEFVQLKLPELLIKQFFVTNETMYIYDGKFLYHYQLITN